MKRRLLPPEWRARLAGHYFPVIIASIIAAGSAIFGALVLALPHEFARIPSFQVAFVWVPPAWWGIAMVSLGVAAISLFARSRRAAAIPMIILGAVWSLWVVPIALSPGYAPSAPVVYTLLSVLTLVTALACRVEPEKTS